MSHIFISYSRQDVEFARYLRALLENAGLRVWMDEKRLHAGSDWVSEIEAAIDTCAAFVVVMSPQSRQSEYVEIEVLHAREQQKPLFPVLLAGTPFFILKNVQYETMTAGLTATPSASFLRDLQTVVNDSVATRVRFRIVQGNILEHSADVAVLKYAKSFHGADQKVATKLHARDIELDVMRLRTIGEYDYVATQGAIAAENALYIGTTTVFALGYRDVREFADLSLRILAQEAPETQHIIATIHGVNTARQLDEGESLLAQLGGYMDALRAGRAPAHLQTITIVEIGKPRTQRLREAAAPYLNEAAFARRSADDEWGYDLMLGDDDTADTPSAGQGDDDAKPFALALMPDDERFDDIFYYGIQRPTHGAGLLCERLSPTFETAEERHALLERIGQAQVVICDVTDLTATLTLQIGYAWGSGRETVLITRTPDVVPFADEPCIAYEKIWQLEERLVQRLAALDV